MGKNAQAEVLDEALTVRDSIIYEKEISPYQEQTYSTSDRINFEQLKQKQYAGKRTIDLVLSFIGCVIFALVYPFFALAIKFSSKGPVIFKQPRTGQNGYSFTCYKFRTMHQLNLRRIDGKPVVTQEGDKRIFWFGSMLRKTNLDELPQIINVLKGDMSLVGPRPYAVDECKHWNQMFEDHYCRYAVKPGITGYAQINGLRGGTYDKEHMRERLDKDLVYVNKQSMSLDLFIIWHTILQMLKLETNAH